MDANWKNLIWRQFGAAIDMLENAVRECPEALWNRGNPAEGEHAFWYMAYHTLFFLDFYLSDHPDTYEPPAPFTKGELDPVGVFPERVYTRQELLAFLEHIRRKCRTVLATMTDDQLTRVTPFRPKNEITVVELHLYNMRHVQHHAAQLNLFLRQNINSAPRWVSEAKTGLES